MHDVFLLQAAELAISCGSSENMKKKARQKQIFKTYPANVLETINIDM